MSKTIFNNEDSGSQSVHFIRSFVSKLLPQKTILILLTAAVILGTVLDPVSARQLSPPAADAQEPNTRGSLLRRLPVPQKQRMDQGEEKEDQQALKSQTLDSYDYSIQADSHPDNTVEVGFAFASYPGRVYFSRSPACGTLNPSYTDPVSCDGYYCVSTRYNPCETECSYVTVTADPTYGSNQSKEIHLDDRQHIWCCADSWERKLGVGTYDADTGECVQAFVTVTVIPSEAGSVSPSSGNSYWDSYYNCYVFFSTYTPSCSYSGRVRVRFHTSGSDVIFSFEQNTALTPSSSWQTVSDSFCSEGMAWINYYQVYRMYLSASKRYNFSLCGNDGVGASCSGDGDLAMYDSACSQKWFIDGASSCGYDASTLGTSYEDWSPPSTGYYYLKVSDYYDDPMSYTLAYSYVETCSPPKDVLASDGTYTSYVRVTWNSVSSPCNYYRVYRATSSGGTKTALGTGCQTSTSYNDTTATPGITYYYWVKSAKDSSCSDASDFSSYNSGWRKLSPPTGVSATKGACSDEVCITWNSVWGASYYLVYRATTPTGTKTALGNWQSSLSYCDGTAEHGVTYYYWVRAATSSSGYRPSGYSAYDTGWLPTPPEAQDDSVTTSVDTPVTIVLQATDEGCPSPPAALTYIITSLPIHGDLYDPGSGWIDSVPYILVGYGNEVEYIPDIGYEGQDSFTFKANDNDGDPNGDSNEATVSINVTACIFFDDFPSPTLDTTNWTETSGPPAVDDTAGYEPNGPSPYSLHLEATDSVTSRVVDLYGCWSAQLNYCWKRVSTESGDDLYLDYWDGNEWKTLHVLPGGANTSWEPNSVELPDGALHEEFRLRFWADCDSNSDEWYIDDVCIQCRSSIESPVLDTEPNATSGLCNTIYWDPIADANWYYAECANDANFTNIDANSGWITDTSYEFCSLDNGQIYWYRVKAWVPFPLKTWLQTSQVDFETDTLTDTIATADGDVILTGGGTPVVDMVGSTNESFGDFWSYFNAFLVTTETTLTQIEVYLGISTSVSIEFVVYEGGALFSDQYNRIHSSTLASSGTGTKFYGSGAISVPLEADRHYVIGAVWSDSVTIYCNLSHSSPTFATHTGWGFCSSFPSPNILPYVYNDAFTFYHRYTTVKATGYTSPGSIVSTAIDLPADGNWVVVDFNTTTPADTELTVDILPAAGLTPIPGYENVSSGDDLSEVSEPTIRLCANLSTTDVNNTPALHDWSVSYTDPAFACESDWSNVESSRQCNTPGDFEPDCDVDGADLRVLCDQWLLEELSADVGPDRGDGFVNLLDWAIFADGWQTTNDIFDLAEFAEQWLKTGSNYYIADIAPGSGDGFVNLLDFATLAENWLLDLTCTVEN